ncbi:unnamed protein product [Leptosia nina]|uniref:Uncharacterized protein n=1 Tax=Leptosia nina TaxID=320188 RepID=A0AAV1JYR3_9NEOP
MIAIGYFHNLALSSKGQLWCWGASPQQVRATHARRASTPSTPATAPASSPLMVGPDPHLVPQLVDTQNVRGKIVQMSAGWHHSCIINNVGTIYTWGLNFDGQLGSGDRKQVQIPSEVKIRTDHQPDNVKGKTTDVEAESVEVTKSLVACGGDFTVYIDDDGRIYATGNMHLQATNEKETNNSRVIMMKTTKRVIKIPASRSNNKFLFQYVDRIDIMFPFAIDDLQRKPIEPALNPLSSMVDFKKKSWADDVILILKPWVNEEILLGNPNMAAKFAYHTKNYSDCLKFSLKTLKNFPQDDQLYFTHQDLDDSDTRKRDELKIIISNSISKRIKDISMNILNEEPYSIVDSSLFASLPCCCDELKYCVKRVPLSITNVSEIDLSNRAAQTIDKCMSLFPIDTKLWETCFRLAKDFFVANNLSVEELEAVLRKYMESDATAMASAIMFSNDCGQYNDILTPKFYLNMCSEILDTWG